MKRRTFLKSLGATAALPVLPNLSALAGAGVAGPSVATPGAIGAGTYKWAEVIARAHSSCSVAMLQRHLRLDVQAATALKAQLVRNGVISAQMNALGMNQAIKPLFDGAFIKPSNVMEKAVEFAKDVVEQALDRTNELEEPSERSEDNDDVATIQNNTLSNKTPQTDDKNLSDSQSDGHNIET